MKKWIGWSLDACVYAGVIMAGGCILFAVFPVMKSEAAAAWVQAVGSIAAIGVAIFVSKLQHSNDLKRDAQNDREAVRRMLQSIHDEIEVVIDGFKEAVGKAIENLSANEYLPAKIYISDRPFPIYRAHASQLGNLPDRELRKQIIRTHNLFASFILATEYHNDVFEEFTQRLKVLEQEETAFREQEIVLAETKFAGTCSRMKEQYLHAASAVDSLLHNLRLAMKPSVQSE